MSTPHGSSPDVSRGRADGRIQSVDRAVALLYAVAAAPRGETLVALATSCGLNRSTAWRLLGTLEDNGLVDRDPVDGRYRLGFQATRLAGAAGHEALVRRARPVLEGVSARTGETSALAVADGREVVYVDEVAAPSVLTVRWVSRAAPMHATSAGRAVLAWLPEAEVDRLLTEPLERFTQDTVTDPDELRRELAATRERGYAQCSGELEPGLCGVAAPIPLTFGPVSTATPDRPLAVLSIWGAWDSADRAARFATLGPLAVQSAAEVADLLRAPRPAADLDAPRPP